MELDPPMINGTTVMDNFGATSDVNGSPMSEGLNDEDFVDDDEDEYENENVADEGVAQEQMSVPNEATTSANRYYGEDMQNFGSFQDMGSGAPMEDQLDLIEYNVDRWTEENAELRIKMRCTDKAKMIYAVRKWSIKVGREFQVIK